MIHVQNNWSSFKKFDVLGNCENLDNNPPDKIRFRPLQPVHNCKIKLQRCHKIKQAQCKLPPNNSDMNARDELASQLDANLPQDDDLELQIKEQQRKLKEMQRLQEEQKRLLQLQLKQQQLKLAQLKVKQQAQLQQQQNQQQKQQEYQQQQQQQQAEVMRKQRQQYIHNHNKLRLQQQQQQTQQLQVQRIQQEHQRKQQQMQDLKVMPRDNLMKTWLEQQGLNNLHEAIQQSHALDTPPTLSRLERGRCGLQEAIQARHDQQNRSQGPQDQRCGNPTQQEKDRQFMLKQFELQQQQKQTGAKLAEQQQQQPSPQSKEATTLPQHDVTSKPYQPVSGAKNQCRQVDYRKMYKEKPRTAWNRYHPVVYIGAEAPECIEMTDEQFLESIRHKGPTARQPSTSAEQSPPTDGISPSRLALSDDGPPTVASESPPTDDAPPPLEEPYDIRTTMDSFLGASATKRVKHVRVKSLRQCTAESWDQAPSLVQTFDPSGKPLATSQNPTRCLQYGVVKKLAPPVKCPTTNTFAELQMFALASEAAKKGAKKAISIHPRIKLPTVPPGADNGQRTPIMEKFALTAKNGGGETSSNSSAAVKSVPITTISITDFAIVPAITTSSAIPAAVVTSATASNAVRIANGAATLVRKVAGKADVVLISSNAPVVTTPTVTTSVVDKANVAMKKATTSSPTFDTEAQKFPSYTTGPKFSFLSKQLLTKAGGTKNVVSAQTIPGALKSNLVLSGDRGSKSFESNIVPKLLPTSSTKSHLASPQGLQVLKIPQQHKLPNGFSIISTTTVQNQKPSANHHPPTNHPTNQPFSSVNQPVRGLPIQPSTHHAPNKVNFLNSKKLPKSVMIRACPKAAAATSQKTESSLAKKIASKPARKIPPPKKRPGVFVEFEDGLAMWIYNRKNITMIDDEPIKSWKLKPGTEVAARYSDGLIYDAVVLRSTELPKEADSEAAEDDSKITTEPTPVENQSKPESNKLKPESNKLKPESNKLKPESNKFKPESIKFKPESFKLKPESNQLKRSNPSTHHDSASKSPATNTIPVKRLKVSVVKLPHKALKTSSQNSTPLQSQGCSETTTSKKSPEVQLKCRPCHIVFNDVATFHKHKNSVCGSSEGVIVRGFKFPDGISTIVDEKSEGAKSNKTQAKPTLAPDGKIWFKEGTQILHRWQKRDGGSRWYHGRVLREMAWSQPRPAPTDLEFEVEYCDDDDDNGPYVVTLYEDFPHDVKVVTR